ncbi:MAG TPA: hypothetical protein VHT70_01770 [Candidatus Saccharimonadales bacterium]|jgi:hypothetical protein|nr:hypothetical protein [Candidatus Saccharimonadales bacterium]
MEGKSFGQEFQEKPQLPVVPEGASDAYDVTAQGDPGEFIAEGTVEDEDGHEVTIFTNKDAGETARDFNDFLEERGLHGFITQKEVPGQEG